MREIKFRAWDGFRYHTVLAWDFEGNPLITINRKPTIKKPAIDFIIEQYTGLKDKNGREIYGGDIVRLDSWNPSDMQIAFIEGAFCLANKYGKFVGDIHYIHHGDREQATVIGNIHENPELLK